MNKKIIGFTLALMASAPCWGINYMSEAVNNSSFTSISAVNMVVSTHPFDEVVGVAVTSATSNGLLTIFDGFQSPFVSTIAIVNLGVVQNPFFYTQVSSGITVNVTGNSNGFTLIWRSRQAK